MLCDDKEAVLDRIPLRMKIKQLLLSERKLPRDLLFSLFSIIKNTFVRSRDNDFNLEFADVYLKAIMSYLKQNISQFQREEQIWVDGLDYVFHLSDTNETVTFEILESLDFIEVILNTNSNFSEQVFYRIYRNLGNFCFSDAIMEKVTLILNSSLVDTTLSISLNTIYLSNGMRNIIRL
jgi:hypothetical protein